ncbi:uncharacterized protein L203_101481 [Cryptococcus depauperatus CBS 7841]|uniref:Uncharacterized protein n=1 Tax=Cryptococcus depauperatus CBS 7841 TaxID=1295531 RepID=A0A1E3ITZ7_9TREE|nr:hypothetical protein L203_01159 [Cryptococcus depauperatus CBS 7841]
MVLINDKKYACEKCIKGHRVSSCTHTDRPLYEVKKKGRPTTQCKYCKEKRKTAGSSVHTKCMCGSENPKVCDVVLPFEFEGQTSRSSPEMETKKGQPGSRATFPNGLKDVHELAAAASALQGLGDDDQVVKAAERTVQALLNPCKCELGEPCSCCEPRRKSQSKHNGSLDSNKSAMHLPAAFESPAGGCSGSPPHPDLPFKLSSSSSLNSENIPRNTHSISHLHKARLFSPYSVDTRHRRESPVSAGLRTPGWVSPRSVRPPPNKIKPLTDMRTLMCAAVNKDGSLASEIPRSAVGLPGIESFDIGANNDGSHTERKTGSNMPLSFPTSEDVLIGACMCGDDCACSGCATHDHAGLASGDHSYDDICGDSCKSHHDCAHSIPIPSGVQSIAQLICMAAAQVPQPPFQHLNSFNPHDTRILPPAASLSEEAAHSMGLTPLKPLECCGSKCRCAPGECVCDKHHCGCCGECKCAGRDEDGDTKMQDHDGNQMGVVAGSYCEGSQDKETEHSLSAITDVSIFSSQQQTIAPHHPNTATMSNIEYYPAFYPALTNFTQPINSAVQHEASQLAAIAQPAASTNSVLSDAMKSGEKMKHPIKPGRPVLPKRASDTRLSKGKDAKPNTLDRSGSLSGDNMARGRVKDDRSMRISYSLLQSRTSAQSRQSDSIYDLPPSVFTDTSSNASSDSRPSMGHDDSDMLSFIQQQWLADGSMPHCEDENLARNMPISVNTELWAFPPQNKNEDGATEERQGRTMMEDFILDDFLKTISSQLEQGQPAQPHQQPGLSLVSSQSAQHSSGRDFEINLADMFLNPNYPTSSQSVSQNQPFSVAEITESSVLTDAVYARSRNAIEENLGFLPSSPVYTDKGQERIHMSTQFQVEKNRQGDSHEDDIIDLSKPLDAKALEKIMTALQKQGQMPSPTPNQSAPSQSQLPLELPQPQQLQRSRLFYQQNLNEKQPLAPQSPVATDVIAKELDDMFNQFVTLDGADPNGIGDNYAGVTEDEPLSGGITPGMGLRPDTNGTEAQETWVGLGFAGNLGWDQPQIWEN